MSDNTDSPDDDYVLRITDRRQIGMIGRAWRVLVFLVSYVLTGDAKL